MTIAIVSDVENSKNCRPGVGYHVVTMHCVLSRVNFLSHHYSVMMWQIWAASRESRICPLLLINGIDVTILWAGLAKRSKEISCSRNLVAARHFYDARRTFYASNYEILVEKKCETHL